MSTVMQNRTMMSYELIYLLRSHQNLSNDIYLLALNCYFLHYFQRYASQKNP